MTSTSIVCTVILLSECSVLRRLSWSDNDRYVAIPIQDCQGLISAIAWLTVALAASTSFLFLLRVLAIFHGQRVVVGLFVLLWLAIVGSAVIVPLNIHGAHIGSTGYCAPIGAGVSVGVFGVITMIDRLLVFLFISWRLTAYHDSRVQAFFRGQGVSIVPRVLLSSGQLYYLWVHLHRAGGGRSLTAKQRDRRREHRQHRLIVLLEHSQRLSRVADWPLDCARERDGLPCIPPAQVRHGADVHRLGRRRARDTKHTVSTATQRGPPICQTWHSTVNHCGARVRFIRAWRRRRSAPKDHYQGGSPRG
jgi:hypothetical protein